MDFVIPIVFPDYLIAMNTPKTSIDILPWVDFDNINVPSKNYHVPELGHAGVLFINGTKGTTKYFEYGRYDTANKGLVRKISISNVKIENNQIDYTSLKKVLREIAERSGQGGKINAAFITVDNKFDAMLSYAELRQKQNSNPQRKPYDLTSNSCIHFVKETTEAAGVDTPWMLDPRPNAYIGKFRSNFPDLDYDKKTDSLKIEGTGQW